MAESLEHSPHLPLAPFVNCHAVDAFAVVLTLFDGMHARRPCHLPFNLNPRLKFAKPLVLEWLLHGHVVLLLMLKSRMCQFMRKIAVVCQDQQTGAVLIEPARRVEACLPVFFGQKIYDGLAAPVVFRGRQHTCRLVHHEVDALWFEGTDLLT